MTTTKNPTNPDRTVTTTVPASVARATLTRLGWTRDSDGRYVAPAGEGYWCLDEALMVALYDAADPASF